MEDKPLVSVIIPLYNAEQYIHEAVQSIVNQTYQNIEIIIIDDGSVDKSKDIVQSISSSKITYIQNEHNIGVSRTRNRGFELAKGKYIALMDADDISISTRLEKQVKFLENHNDYGVVSSHYESFREHLFGVKRRIRKLSTNAEDIHVNLLFSNMICCPSSMIRKEVLIENNIKFDTSLQMAEDYDLWRRLSFVTKITNLDEVLLKYRKHKNNSIKNRVILDRDFTRVIIKSFAHLNINIHNLFDEEYKLINIQSFLTLNEKLERIIENNVETQVYHQEHLKSASAKLLHCMFKKHIHVLGHDLYEVFNKLPLFELVSLSKREKLQLFFLPMFKKWGTER